CGRRGVGAVPRGQILQVAIAPITGGLLLAASAYLVRAADHGWRTAAITGAVTLLALTTRLHPLLLLAAGVVAGIIGYF
ncbi:MAG TPA: hypothetical protein VF286_05650, partial [Acidiphilium sp.]